MFKRTVLILAAAAFASAAMAADLNAQTLPPLITKAPAVLPSNANPCTVATASTPLSCTGAYVGGGIGGQGSNADILGSGISGSVFAGGVTPWLNAGYQYISGNWILAAETDLGYSMGSNATINGIGNNFNGLRFEMLFKVGGNLSALLGQQQPITVPASLSQALLGMYAFEGGAWWQLPGTWATGNVAGAGALFDFGSHLFGDLRYSYTNFGGAKFAGVTLNNDQSVKFMLDYKF